MTKNDVLLRFNLRTLADTRLKLLHRRLTQSAVLIPLVQRNDIVHVILTKRSSHLRHHPGQISFPGGKYDNGDSNLKTTALRETFEELNISAQEVEIIGELPSHDTVTGFSIKPYLGFVSHNCKMAANAGEVSEIIEIPLSEFVNNPAHFMLPFQGPSRVINLYFKPSYGYGIWGATAAIIEQFRLSLID